MNTRSAAILSAGIFVFASCVTKSSLQNLDFHLEPEALVFDNLIGTWKSEDGKSFERWDKFSDGTYHSTVYMLKGNDTIFMEQADIFKEKDHWIFENVVAGQNQGKKTRFTSAEMDGNSVSFRNPEHDFPNEIHYSVPDLKTINAFIVGKNEQGGTDTIPFNYKKI